MSLAHLRQACCISSVHVCVCYLSKDDWLQAVCTISLNSVPLRLGRRLFHRGKQCNFRFLSSALFWPKFTCDPIFYSTGVIVLLSVWIMNEAAANCKIPTSRCFCSCSLWPTSSRSSGGCDIRAQVQTGYKEYYDQESSGETKGHAHAGSKNEPSLKNGIEICPAVVKWMWEWKESNWENKLLYTFFAKIDFDFTQKKYHHKWR